MTRNQLLCLATFALASSNLASAAHAQGGACHDPWINQAYNKLYHRVPAGSNLSGECNPALYGGGRWTTYNDLESKILLSKGTQERAMPAPASAAPVALHLDRSANLVNASGAVVAPAGTFNLVSKAGSLIAPSAIVAQGGGNIVAQGGGNIVAQGGGNMRSLQSVGSRPTYIVQ